MISEEVEEARNAEILLELDHLGMIQVNVGLVRAIGRRSKGGPVDLGIEVVVEDITDMIEYNTVVDGHGRGFDDGNAQGGGHV